jgi:hypothetical protein
MKQYTQRRVWKESDNIFLAKLARINRKRAIDNPMTTVEFFDLLVRGKAPRI